MNSRREMLLLKEINFTSFAEEQSLSDLLNNSRRKVSTCTLILLKLKLSKWSAFAGINSALAMTSKILQRFPLREFWREKASFWSDPKWRRSKGIFIQMTYFNSNDTSHFNKVRFPGTLNLVKMLTNAISSLWFFSDIIWNYESIFVTVTSTETALKHGNVTTVVNSKSCLDIFSLFTHKKNYV